jgi:hypothetical protein
MSGPNSSALQVRAYLEEKHQLLVLDNFEFAPVCTCQRST